VARKGSGKSGKGAIRGEGMVDTMGCSSSVGVSVTGRESGINGLAEVASEGMGEVETKSLSSPVAGKGGMVGGPKSAMGKKALPRGISRGEQPLGHGGTNGVGVGYWRRAPDASDLA
jgi:hypothetical protein